MSFYHVLPSNAAPNTFPNNHASAFSTPLNNPYQLSGQWEVAMMNMSYTGCVNTFNNDTLSVKYKTDFKTRILKTSSPVTWKVPQRDTVGEMLTEMKTQLKDIIKISTRKEGVCEWTLQVKHMFVVLSSDLTLAVELEQDIISPWDGNVRNWRNYAHDDPMPKNVAVTFVPLAYTHSKIELKAPNEEITVQQLIERFNKHVPNATMSYEQADMHLSISITKSSVFLLSNELFRFMNYMQSGMYLIKPVLKFAYNQYSSMNVMEKPWTVSVYDLNFVEDHATHLNQTISLPPISFQYHTHAVAHLNKSIPLIKFTCDKDKYLQFVIEEDHVSVTFSNTLRDIFAFDENTYTGKGTYKASGVFSLTRRIHYLYVYSSITDYVRIGNTEAPLLAVIPFPTNNTCDILREQLFKNPMYVPIRHSTISQIDIEIHDDAGELVPFVAEAVTSLRIHYRKT